MEPIEGTASVFPVDLVEGVVSPLRQANEKSIPSVTIKVVPGESCNRPRLVRQQHYRSHCESFPALVDSHLVDGRPNWGDDCQGILNIAREEGFCETREDLLHTLVVMTTAHRRVHI